MHLMNLLGDRDPRVMALRRIALNPGDRGIKAWWHWTPQPLGDGNPRGEWAAVSRYQGLPQWIVRLGKTLGPNVRTCGNRQDAERFCDHMNKRHREHGKRCHIPQCCKPIDRQMDLSGAVRNIY